MDSAYLVFVEMWNEKDKWTTCDKYGKSCERSYDIYSKLV